MPPSRPRQLLVLVGWLGLTLGTGAIGAAGSLSARDFYATLQQPSWAPPGWLFGPVWTSLYLLMGFAAWLVWRERGFRPARIALWLFVAQLGLNALWSWLFFAWRQGAWAFIDILLLLALIIATLASFARHRPLAAWLLAPYLAWVTFATFLCFAVWQRNPSAL
jgi:translocator protein